MRGAGQARIQLSRLRREDTFNKKSIYDPRRLICPRKQFIIRNQLGAGNAVTCEISP
jgi:hypothetical protein